ncbi:MAG: V-type ATPase subunit [Oscillospiraceae bacterium]|nr:V-type ATPase subunit [Candidatus Ruminococcus equi]
MTDYTYAVARIRSREGTLLSNADLETLINQKDVVSCIRFLSEKGFGDNAENTKPEKLLKAEDEKTWQFVRELLPDLTTLDFFLMPNDFHNLKVAIKCITRNRKADDFLLDGGTVDAQFIYSCVEKRDYDSLPQHLSDVAQTAMKTLLQTSDGQLCDFIIDKACLESVYKCKEKNENEIIKLYCELFVASADIKIAVRCAKTGKSLDFILKYLVPCDSLNVEKLAKAAAKSVEDISEYLLETDYKTAVDALQSSMSAFEKWCDDYLTNAMKPQKWEPFSIGPIVAFVIARNNEIKAVRMILTAKTANIDTDVVRERLREMYV